MKSGLLGHPLGHSFSPQLHAALGNPDYGLFDVPPEGLPDFLARPDITALNVTIPYKEAVLPYLAGISAQAETIGCVNTLVRNQDGQWYGENTDFDGVCYMLDRSGIDVRGAKCLILGGGATSKTVHAVLRQRQASAIIHIVRHDGIGYDELPAHFDADLIFNTTPVGMYPNAPKRLISLDGFRQLRGVCDVIYNPLRSQLILDAMTRGIPAIGGLAMLVGQAVVADAHFHRRNVDFSQADRLLNELHTNRENMVLIGMPGVGKSTVGRALAAKTGRTFVDLDDVVAENHGPVPDIINHDGIDAFRALEHEAAVTWGKAHGLVIACGGGVVTRSENAAPLKQNGRLYWLQRPLHTLPTNGRPLSAGGQAALEDLAEIRRPLYQSFADQEVENKSIEYTVQAILEDFYAHSRP